MIDERRFHMSASLDHASMARRIAPWVVSEQTAQAVSGDPVDEVPPRAFHDHPFVHPKRRHVLEALRGLHPGEFDRGVPLLPIPGVLPKPECE